MVLILNARQFHTGKWYLRNVQTIPKNEVLENPSPDPIMKNIQQDTNVSDLGEANNTLEGAGFKVYGGGSKASKPKNAKLRKFISLNIK